MQVNVTHPFVQVLPDGRVSRTDAATYLGRSPKTLAEWSRLGAGPQPRKVGGRIFYLLEDLEAFVSHGVRRAC